MSLLQQEVSVLAGVGPHTLHRLKKLELYTLLDLLLHLPIRYEDRTRLCPINTLEVGQTSLVCGRVEQVNVIPSARKILVCHINDGNGLLALKFLNFSPSQRKLLENATWLQCFGEVRLGYGGGLDSTLEMMHPEFALRTEHDAHKTENTLTPIYPCTEGLNQSLLRRIIAQALKMCDSQLVDYLPNNFLQKFNYPTFRDALLQIHAPTGSENKRAFARLAHEELIVHYLSMRSAKMHAKRFQSPVFTSKKTKVKAFLATLPFSLTKAQLRVIEEIQVDCAKPEPMLRLLQGDVGSGKTLVAAVTALVAIKNGYQVALMVPTELLAEQHCRNFIHWFLNFDVRILFLTGQLKGKARVEGLKALAAGQIDLVIGTHALFQEQVQFKKLGLTIVDEQHRFGVHQRLALRDKGRHQTRKGDELYPHQLVMTATPIPRTLAMMNYADLDVSIIDELPPNRTPVITRVISAQRREEVIVKIDEWVRRTYQAYWVCTLIEDSEVMQGEAAIATSELLTQALPNVRVGLVHGRMKAAEKESVMSAFKAHELDLLVATTVIEVGVDVPNAALMVIENPERLGLSQLHQLRGRVGRGQIESYCLLLYSSLPDMAQERLTIMRESNDGFVIAEKDLELRGAGEVLGTRQKGQLRFKTVVFPRDEYLIESVQEIGDKLVDRIPQNIPLLINRWLSNAESYVDV
ncbi:MAG: ATP-dependent helicase RecG [Pseudomonadota bacterium]